jgi:hypothetical protein
MIMLFFLYCFVRADGLRNAGPRGDAGGALACRRLSARTGGNSGAHEYPQFGIIVWNRQLGTSSSLRIG